MGNSTLAEFPHEILREIDGERQIVARVDEQCLPVAYPIEVPARADGFPEGPERRELDVPLEAVAHVTRREAVPDDVREVRRDVVERLRSHEWLVRRRE